MNNQELILELKHQGITDKKVLEAMEKVPRHLFISQEFQKEAYANYPLPVGEEQTISQPYTTAFMLQALELKENLKVLEIGAASGWSACLIAEIVKPKKVYTLEIIPKLAELAKSNIKKLNIKNIEVICADGSKGYKKEAPHDRIVITAACPRIPQVIIKQLKNNGILVAPVGSMLQQSMIKIKKIKNKIAEENLGEFIFVPLKGKYGYRDN